MKNRTIGGGTVTAALAAATLFIVPLALTPALVASDVTPKLLALLAGACAVWIAFTVAGARPQGPRWFFASLAALAVCGALSTIFSSDHVLSIAGSEWRRLGLPAWLACLAIAAAIPAAGARRMLHGAIAAAGTIAAIYAFAQYSGHDPWINAALYHIGEGEWQIVRPPSTFGYVSYFALYEAAAVFVAAGLALDEQSRAWQCVWGASAAAMTLAVILSGSRGVLVGVAAGAVALGARVARDAHKRRAVLAAALAIVVAAGAFVASPWGQPVRSRVKWFVEDQEGGGRLLLWRDSAKLIGAHPLFGTGLETFGREFAPVESLDLAQRFPDRYVESPHNTLLDYATSAGLPALAAFAVLMTGALRSADPATFAALVAGLVAAQFVADTITTRLLLMSLVGLAIPPAPPARFTRGPRWAVGGIAVAAAIFAGVFGARLISADRHAVLAERAIARGDLDAVVEEGRASSQAFPWGGVYAFRQSRLLGQVAMLAAVPPAARSFLLLQAGAAAGDALAHVEQQAAVHLQLASIAGLGGDLIQAQAELEAAVRASPAWFRPHWQLALLLAQASKPKEAAEQATAALERGARAFPDVEAQCVRIQTSARPAHP